MSGDTNTSKPQDSKSANAEKIEDLKDSRVTEDESAKVKGGLNPQPLPPRHR